MGRYQRDELCQDDQERCLTLCSHEFRALGLDLLAPNRSPGISQAFAIPAAAVDFFTAILALLAFVGYLEKYFKK